MTDVDVFVRYVLGIRRFTAAHIEAVDRYLVTSWGEDMAILSAARFLDRFQVLEDRRAPIRFTRKVPALVDTRQVVTWRANPAGAAAIGIGPIPADVPGWAELPGGWEVLVVL